MEDGRYLVQFRATNFVLGTSLLEIRAKSITANVSPGLEANRIGGPSFGCVKSLLIGPDLMSFPVFFPSRRLTLLNEH